MPKLLQINVTANSGSTGKIAEQIGQYAIKNEWESYIAYSRKANKSSSHLIKIGNKLDIISHGICNRIFDNQGLLSKQSTKVLIREIEKINPNIIHLHNIHGYFLNYPILFDYLTSKNIPIFWTLHDCWTITGHCAYFSYINCNKWKTLCHNCPLKQNYPRSYIFDRSKKNYIEKKEYFTKLNNITIITVSEWLHKIISESFLNRYNIKTIKNGVDLNVFAPETKAAKDKIIEKYKLKNKTILLGVANMWEKRKGLYDYIELANRLKEKYQIVLVGVTNQQKKNLPNNIIGINKTENQKELAVFYCIADIVLNLSYEETFGMTTVEGFACGTPSIVYNTTASPELISKDTGFIVEPRDFNKIIECIDSICSKGKDFYLTSCRSRAEKYYNKEEKAKEYFSLYTQMLTEIK